MCLAMPSEGTVEAIWSPVNTIVRASKAHDTGINAVWYRLEAPIPPAGGWLSFAWEASLVEPVSRPLLVFAGVDQAGEEFECDALLAGTAFGRQSAIVPVPPGTHEILLSPGSGASPFHIRLTEARWLSGLVAFMRGLTNQPLMALHAFGAALIGRPWDFRLLLTEALQTVPLARYARWKHQRSRRPDWKGLDYVDPKSLPAIHVFGVGGASLIPASDLLPPDLKISATNLTLDAGSRERLIRELGGIADESLVILLPTGVRLLPLAIPSLAQAAANAPDAVLFFGDEEVGQAPELRILTGFDPLWSFRRLEGSASFAVRAAFLRRWLETGMVPDSPMGVALFRPLIACSVGAKLLPMLAECLGAMHAAWPENRLNSAIPEYRASIIIPTRDRLDLLKSCIESLESTIPIGTEIVIVDNDSADPATHKYLQAFAAYPHRIVVQVAGKFNFSRLSNIGAREASGNLLVFLNNDTTIITPDWLSRLARFSVQPGVGAVGARLLYPSGRVQHAGVVLGIGGFAGHVDLNMPGSDDGPLGWNRASHAVMAVTGACLAVDKAKFEAIGGFDEVNLPVDLNDIDLCLRLSEKGWRSILAADVELVHHESASRGKTGPTSRYRKEKAYFADRWRSERQNDSFFHPALSLLLTRIHLG